MPASNSVPDPNKLLGRHEAARFAGVSTTWLDRAALAGKVPSYKYAGKVRYDPADLRERTLLAKMLNPFNNREGGSSHC